MGDGVKTLGLHLRATCRGVVLPILGSTYLRDQFNDWGGRRGCNIFDPVLGGNGTKIAPTGNIFDQSPGQMR